MKPLLEMFALGLGILFTALFLWLITPAADAHEAPTGWAYDATCCSNRDCRQASHDEVNEGPDGYTYRGQFVAYGDRRIRQSGDEFYHVCTIAGKPDGRVLCIYEPLRGF